MLRAVKNLTVDFFDLDWVIIALFMRVNYCGNMEFTWGAMKLLGGPTSKLKFQTALKVLMVLIYLYMVFTF